MGKGNNHACEASELKSATGTNSSQTCEICKHLENPLKMLICDNCEGAFHLSCHQPRVKVLPIDYWFCRPCHCKHSRALLIKSTENLAGVLNASRNYHGRDGPVICMLRDDQTYMSRVRIGNDYQAEVPDWNGPASEYVVARKGNNHACGASGRKSAANTNSFQPCEICGHLQNPLKMLICDNCEGAFHLSCLHPRVKDLPVGYWFCRSCHRKKNPRHC